MSHCQVDNLCHTWSYMSHWINLCHQPLWYFFLPPLRRTMCVCETSNNTLVAMSKRTDALWSCQYDHSLSDSGRLKYCHLSFVAAGIGLPLIPVLICHWVGAYGMKLQLSSQKCNELPLFQVYSLCGISMLPWPIYHFKTRHLIKCLDSMKVLSFL